MAFMLKINGTPHEVCLMALCWACGASPYAACRVGSVIELRRDTRAGASSGK